MRALLERDLGREEDVEDGKQHRVSLLGQLPRGLRQCSIDKCAALGVRAPGYGR